ncbi:hypothetical protein WR25_20033 [Diploscapter pachys]|uniref:DH domain-containing protein n=1 Tax=Diploscapter pachys TaxID=2018661 RepID=A0A2A2JU30_9BILA|nr:hypothetical protein WR25_20033 [Diploscapter pachys]
MTSDSEELWRSCVRWLLDLGVIDRSHLPTNELKVKQFASILRDGVLLCKTAEMLCPGCIPTPPEIQKNTQLLSQFISSKNIVLFLNACRNTFNIPEEFLFEPLDLYHYNDFVKVLQTLSILSHTNYSKCRDIQPFPEKALNEAALPCCPLRANVVEEEIYRNLNEEVEDVEGVDQAIYGDINKKEAETHIIYEHLVNRRDSQRKERDEWYKFVPTTKREYSIKELLDTETNYVDKALQMIMSRLYSPLRLHLKEDDHKAIFINISELYELHQKFHNDLRQSILRTLGLNESSNGRPISISRNIGEIFLMYKDKFVAYGPYCTKLDESRERILQLEKSDSNAKARILECTSANDNQFKLQDLLCLPMQRILKYSLLLQELLKHTPIESPDRKSLDLAKEAMDDINSYINEMKRDHEMMQFIDEVEKSISDLTMPTNVKLSDYGRLNLDGEVKLLETYSSHSGKMKQRYVFIFDKVIIICQANRNNTYKYKNAHILCEFSISQDSSIPAGGTITKKLLAGNHQHILHFHRAKAPNEKDRDPVTQIAMAFKSEPQKQRWMQQFELSK